MTAPWPRALACCAGLALALFSVLPSHAADRWGRPRESFVNWENPHVHPLDLTPNGQRLLAVNTADNRLLVFNVASGAPVLEAAIPVGLDPISVRARSDTEAWVVNRISDNVSVVDLSTRTVTAVLPCDDEPADVVFAGSPQRAYVSCAKPSLIDVFDPAALASARQTIFVNGKEPRALATSADGLRVFVAFFESGNGTTLITGGKDDAPIEVDLVRRPEGPYGGVNVPPNRGTQFVPPLNPANPPPPPLSMIVRKDAAGRWKDDNNGDWTRFISGDLSMLGGAQGGRVAGWDLPDRDVAIIDTATRNVTYQTRLMNSLMALAVRPGTGEVTVVGLDATNEIRWEPNLQGTFIRVNLARFQPGRPSTISDLNPHLDYTVRNLPPATRTASIGDPRGIAWNADGSRAFVTGMGSNNVVVIDGAGARIGRVSVGEGPTGVVVQPSSGRVFVLNKFEASISVINAAQLSEVSRVPFFDPTPTAIRQGRKHLYNTQTGSGLGQISCASCHIDGRTDRLAWDLGNPAGTMTPMTGRDDRTGAVVTVQQPPMKGPLLTQTLQDTMNSPDFHWSGDKADLAHFRDAFVNLQGADARPSTAAIGEFEDFLDSIHIPPNPYRNLDNSYSTSVAITGPENQIIRRGDAIAGAREFEQTCRTCHPGQTARGDGIRQGGAFGLGLNRRAPTWRNFHERVGLWFKSATGSTSGFGFQQDGSFDSTQNQTRTDAMMAFMYSFNGSFPYTPQGLNETNRSRDTHAAVGRQLRFAGGGATAADDQLLLFLTLAEQGEVGLVARGQSGGVSRGFAYVGDGVFQSDRRSEWWTPAQVRALPGVIYTVVPAGSEIRIGIDRDLDGVFDGDDADPARPAPLVRAVANIAPRGAARQSSDFGPELGAARALDQSTTSFAQTASSDFAPVWEVTLDDTYAIDRLVLLNRPGFESRLRDVTVYFLDAAGNAIYRSHFLNRNNRLLGPAQLGIDLPTDLGAPIRARGLRIVRTPDRFARGEQVPANSADEANVLTLPEVQLFGATPTDDPFPVSTTPRPLPGGTFENVEATGTFVANPPCLPWSFRGTSGVSGNGSTLTAANPPAPQGRQVMFLQGAGAAQQDVRLAPGSYLLSLRAAQRGGVNVAPQTVLVVVDGVEVGRFRPTDTSYAAFQTARFALPFGTYQIRLAGLGQTASGTAAPNAMAFVDDVRIVSANVGPVVTAIDAQSTPRGASVSLPVRATDPGGFALRYSAVGLPKGLAIDPASGLITGTVAADAAATNAVTVAVNNGSLSASVAFAWSTTSPPVASLTEDFNATTIDSTKWTLGSLYAPAVGVPVDSAIGILQQSGTLQIRPRANIAGESYRGVVSTAAVNFRGASAAVQVTPAGGSSNTWLALVSGRNSLVIGHEASQLWLEQMVGGVRDFTLVPFAAAMRFWRIRHDVPTDTVLFQVSADGLAWTTLRNVARGFDLSQMRIELAAGTYRADPAPTAAIFDNLRCTPSTVPAPWDGSEVGVPARRGSDTFANGAFTVSGGGPGYSGTTDTGRFVSQTLTGNGEIVARVVSQSNTNVWAKAGVMIRDSHDPRSRMSILSVTQGDAIYFQSRLTLGGTATRAPFPRGPRWLRLVRRGSTITASSSADGVTWTVLGSNQVAFGATVSIGLAVTSSNGTLLSTAVFDSVRVTPLP